MAESGGFLNDMTRSMLNSMMEGVIAVGPDFKILFTNKAMAGFFELDESGAEGLTPIEAIRNPVLNNFIKNVFDSKRPQETEIEMVTPVESVFKARANIFDFGGGRNGVITVLSDITEIRRLEKIRSEFAANVSHELKTPLASIKGYVETLLDGALDDKQNNVLFLKTINGQVERLERLINDIMELSKIESGKTSIIYSTLNVKTVLDSALKVVEAPALKKKIALTVSTSDSSLVFKGDQNKIELAVVNLLDNAIKFTPAGGKIGLSAFLKEGRICIVVVDNGAGIQPILLPRIFERFYMIDKARSGEFGGTGLGLSIVKHVMEAHNGSVLVESEPGKGSKFTLSFPD
ncbi:MAG: ATP-binding protein [Candidatus Firestonebacteria bacterium]